MDKLKSIAWVGKNISQKFETMCQQVDNIVSQDNVKYVENQMHTIGGSMKRFYSDVILDLLPPLADPVKHEAQEVVVKKNDRIGTYIQPVIGIEENSANTTIEQSQEELNPVDQMKNQLDHAVSGLCHENQFITPTSVDPVDVTESDLALGKINDVLAHEICDVDVEDNGIKEKSSTSELLKLMSLGEKNSSEALSCCETIDNSNKNACGVVVEISHATSVNVVGVQSNQSANIVCNNFANDSMSVSDASNTFAASEMALSAASCEGKISEPLMSSSYSRLVKSNNLHKNSLDYLTLETALCTDSVDVVGVYDSCKAITSATLAPIISEEDKEGEAELINFSSSLSLKSREENVSRSDYTELLTEISQKTNAELHVSTQFESLATSSDNASTGPSHHYSDDLDYSGMETIQLCENAKLEDSCIMVDDRALYAVSYRTWKLRSFKKMIQAAFASKRRLAKEYEELAIWYGDIYMEASQDAAQILLPSTTSAIAVSENSSENHTCDSEWELL